MGRSSNCLYTRVMYRPSLLVQQVYREQIHRYGEPALALTYDERTARGHTPLESVMVMVWPADQEVEVTTFMTTGMSERPMPGGGLRAELHFGIRDGVSTDLATKVCGFLANLAQYPWLNLLSLGWGHVVVNPGSIPAFPRCTSVLFHSRLSPTGWDSIEVDGEQVKLLYVLPIPEIERQLLEERGLEALHSYWADVGVDVLADRTLD